MCDDCESCDEIPNSLNWVYDRISCHPTNPNLMRLCMSVPDASTYIELINLNKLSHSNIPKAQEILMATGSNNKRFVHYSMNKCIPLVTVIKDLDIVKIKKIFEDIGSVIIYLYNHGVYHQNIHPNSIMVDPLTLKPYIINFKYANLKSTIRGSWVDPWIMQEYYTTWVHPSKDKMLQGNLWSLGVLGIWMFIDRNVYNWIEERSDDETIDISYLIKGRFGFGISNANLNLRLIPKSIIWLIDSLIQRPDKRDTGLNYFKTSSNITSKNMIEWSVDMLSKIAIFPT